MATCSWKDQLFLIRSTHPTGLVLDATESSQIHVQHFNGYNTQLWKFEPGTMPGWVYIISNHTGNVLSVFGTRQLGLGQKSASLSQQWSLTLNGRIANVGTKENVDISNEVYKPGAIVKTWKDNGCQAQEFILIKKVNA